MGDTEHSFVGARHGVNRLSSLQLYVLATMLKEGIGESSGSECGWTGVRCNVNNTVIFFDLVQRGTALASALSKDLGLLSNREAKTIRATIPSEL